MLHNMYVYYSWSISHMNIIVLTKAVSLLSCRNKAKKYQVP